MAALKGYDIKLSAESVARLKRLSRELSFTQNQDISWPALVRLGVRWVLESGGDPSRVLMTMNNKETE